MSKSRNIPIPIPASLTAAVLLLLVGAAVGNGGEIGVYELKKGDGEVAVRISNYGATVLSLHVPDRHGKLDDIVLGFQSIDDYKNDTAYFGSIVGRVANRISGAKFNLSGQVYHLPPNDHGNTLHGGTQGFSDVVWKVREFVQNSHLSLTYDSHDGEQGFPGKLTVTVTYFLIGRRTFAIRMEATPHNKPTPVNLATHTYWNLAGHGSGDVLSHTLHLHAAAVTPVDAALIPTGRVVPVQGTPYDFLQPRPIGSRLAALPGGYDINYVVDRSAAAGHLAKVATVREAAKTGRKMEMWSNQVGVQVYTSNMLNRTAGKGGAVYGVHAGLCLETQGFPDAVNRPNFPSQVVRPGEKYLHVVVYRFTAA
ncbi:uncharacterized protein LOC127246147 [Andrographis paniculata]|uniref:uncharacterized protein LOC127246147 n=1 Tax=Andrographis paniculata TaxID=175694 RepID=UPI0021E990A8|nr:uncharacterized protein LOC127246147 [Andrographis paniculata]